MIDWEQTKSRFGISEVVGYRPKVICRCDGCDVGRVITIRVKSKVINNQMTWICPRCVASRKEVRDKLSKAASVKWQDRQYRLRQGVSSKKLWDNNEYREIISSRSREQFADKGRRQRMSEYYREKYVDSDYREQRRQYSLKLWQDEKFRDNVLAAYDDQWRAKHSRIMKVVRNRADVREKLAEARQNQPRVSSQQKMLYAILDDMGIGYVPEYSLGYYSFDCFIEDYDLLIEVQGEYWHSLPRAISNDKAKATYVERYFPSLSLKYLSEQDFLFYNRVVSLLHQWLDIDQNKQVDFQFQDIRVVRISERAIAKDFLNRYHYIGTLGKGGYVYGAYLDDVLVAVAVFSKPTRHESTVRLKTDVRELTRFCIHPSYHKKNFASWLLSRCERFIVADSGCEMLLAFSDPMIDHVGTIYKAANWQFDGYTSPSYYYVDEDGYVMHKKTLYNHACKMKMRESEYANKYKYKKVHVDKKYRYIKEIK